MEPEWLVWLRENMDTHLYEDFLADREHDCGWRDQRISQLVQENQDLAYSSNGMNAERRLGAREGQAALLPTIAALEAQVLELEARIAGEIAHSGSMCLRNRRRADDKQSF